MTTGSWLLPVRRHRAWKSANQRSFTLASSLHEGSQPGTTGFQQGVSAMSDAGIKDALATMYDAGAVRVPPWCAVVSALACARPSSIEATIDWLVEHRHAFERAYDRGATSPLALAQLQPEMEYEPELGYMDRAKNDHALRERFLFDDVVGKKSFFQTAVYAMTGIDITPRDVELLDQMGNANLLVDRHVWPMAATRRVAARGGGHSASVVAGLAMMASPMLAGEAAGNCARFLQRARRAVESGGTVHAYVAEILAQGERVMGFGRPVVGPDERVPVMTAVLERYGRFDLPFVTLLREADCAFFAHKGLRSTSAAWAAAILSDYGMTPEHVHAVSNFWVAVTVYSQSLFSGEHAIIEKT
jgi:hypothetical protein